jgi:hypothetical protein
MNLSPNHLQAIQQELASLDNDLIEINGQQLRASQCYHFETDPLHLLFNTNCPAQLREKLNGIVAKYIPGYESSLQE